MGEGERERESITSAHYKKIGIYLEMDSLKMLAGLRIPLNFSAHRRAQFYEDKGFTKGGSGFLMLNDCCNS